MRLLRGRTEIMTLIVLIQLGLLGKIGEDKSYLKGRFRDERGSMSKCNERTSNFTIKPFRKSIRSTLFDKDSRQGGTERKWGEIWTTGLRSVYSEDRT